MKFFHLLFLLFPFTVLGQTGLYPVTLEERISNSTFIAEGKVIHKESFKGNSPGRIYTLNTIEVYKIFKGDPGIKSFVIKTEGGIVGNEYLHCSELLKLRDNDEGVFFCIQGNEKTPGIFSPYSSKQGFIQVNYSSNSAGDVFNKYEEGIVVLFEKIKNKIGQDIIVVKERKTEIPNGRSIPVINSFSPAEVTAGTNTRLTISGTGFGNTRGSGFVGFSNSDDGGRTIIKPIAVQYISWTNTQIIVEVPSDAGTGPIDVSDGIVSTTSLDPLLVRFSRVQIEHEGNIYSPVLVAKEAGGYPWRMNKSFFNDSLSKASFLRAFNTWRCGTWINWFIGPNTDIDQTERDNINVIRYDAGGELPAGVLGVCYSYFSACTNTQWFVEEYDIIFDKEARWNFSSGTPTPGNYDFETVALHELGHGHQLGHVINSDDLMHYALGSATIQRLPNAYNIEAGNLVITQSKANPVCGFSPMELVNGDVCNDSRFAWFKTEPPKIYPNPFTGLFHISYFLSNDQDVEVIIFNSLGQQVAVLAKGTQKAGFQVIDADPQTLSLGKGVFIIRSSINEKDYTKKVISIK